MKNDFYKNLCIKELTNNISSDEKQKLAEWLKLDSKNRNEYEVIKSTWNSLRIGDINPTINIENEWENVKDSINSQSMVKKTFYKSSFYNFMQFPKLKPILVSSLILVLIISSVLFFRNNETINALKTVKTLNNQIKEIELSDGSFIKLNSSSEVKFFENFSKNKRAVELKGEAFFNIKNDGRQFIVNSNNTITTVLGTKFNIWSRNNKTRILVAEGKVTVHNKLNKKKKVQLEKNQLSNVLENKDPETPVHANSEYMLGWLNGILVFEKTSLVEIVKELEIFYDTKVSIKNENISNYKLTGSFKREEIDSVISKICLALDLNYMKKNGSYNIYKN